MRDAVATMGTILPEEIREGTRDAVHVACIAVTSIWAQPIKPGTDVNQIGLPLMELVDKDQLVGIVDPFLKAAVLPGQKFWLYLYPRTITGLNHHWTHPAFPEGEEILDQKDASAKWLKEFCRDNDAPNYDDLMEYLRYHAEHGQPDDGLWIGDQECMAEIPKEFWHHAEIVMDKRFVGKHARYFRCAC